MVNIDAPSADSMTALISSLPNQIAVIEPVSRGSDSDPCVPNLSRPLNHQRASSEQIYSNNRKSLSPPSKGTLSSLTAFSVFKNNSAPFLPKTYSSDNIQAQATSLQARPLLVRSESHPGLGSNPQTKRKSALLTPPAENPTSVQTVSTMAPDRERERSQNRMHQTSSKILRMTDTDRPFVRDFKDLFGTLITSLPLTPHRVRFTKIDLTFSSEEAITNLGSLKFSQSNRIPDPRNPSRWVITTTTTTFSMTKDMARTVCQQFLDARFIESAESKTYTNFMTKGCVWQLTPKGVAIMQRFCNRNGIVARHIEPILRLEQMQIVVLERDSETDKFVQDKGSIELIFRRFIGGDEPNVKNSTSVSDSDSVHEYATGLVGVKMARERRVGDKMVSSTFTGKAASDWLLDCSTIVDRKETHELAESFIKWQLIECIQEDKQYIRQNPLASRFQPTKNAIFAVTEKGQILCGWLNRPTSVSSDESRERYVGIRAPKDSNVTRLNVIIRDHALRSLFREFLRVSLCEENLSFYLDVSEFTLHYQQLQQSGKLDKPEAVRDTLAAAFGIYNSFLASGAPSELNIDHSLRSKLDNHMIQTNNTDEAMKKSLDDVVELFEIAQGTVFKLMASDSVPKFIRDPKNAVFLRDHEIDMTNSTRAHSPSG